MSKRDGMKRIRVSPGIVRGKQYTVLNMKYHPESRSSVRPVLKRKQYAISTEDTELGFGTRQWAYLMEKHSPYGSAKSSASYEVKAKETVLRAIEDLRLYSLAYQGKTFIEDITPIRTAYNANVSQQVDIQDTTSVAINSMLYLAHHSVDIPIDIKTCIPSDLMNRLDLIADKVKNKCEDHRVTEQAYNEFMDLFKESGDESSVIEHIGGMGNNPYLDIQKKDIEEIVPLNVGAGENAQEPNKWSIDEIMEKALDEGGVLNGVEFRIIELKMPIIHHRTKNRGVVATDFGIVPRYAYRYPWGPLFTMRAKRDGGGTILIDNSGSMNFTYDEIIEMVKVAPVASVASYNGDGRLGIMYVLARNGRMATDTDIEHATVGSGNIVDYHSLLWLRTQQHPRIWISDKGVTGLYDRFSTDLKRTCEKICADNKITIVRGMGRATELLKHGR